MPIVSSVQVTSFVQFDGDQTTAVHTRTVVEISEDGDVLIEDSAEIDNARGGVRVRQSALVDTESSQMLLHSETQQDRPEFDPKAPPNDITVEQKSDLVEDDDTKEAQTNVTIGPEHWHSPLIAASSHYCAGEANDKRKSLTNESSLTQGPDLNRSFGDISIENRGKKAGSTADKQLGDNRFVPTSGEKTVDTSSAGNRKLVGDDDYVDSESDTSMSKQKAASSPKEFSICDVEGIHWEGKPAYEEAPAKEVKRHEVDIIQVNLPKVIDLLSNIQKSPAHIPKVFKESTASPPFDENQPETTIALAHQGQISPGAETPNSPLMVDPLEDSLSPDSIRRRSLTQLGARPKQSALNLLSEDTSMKVTQKEPQVRTESMPVARIQSSPAEVRTVSFDTKLFTKESPFRDEVETRVSQEKQGPDCDELEDMTENISGTDRDQTPKKAAGRNPRRQLRPSFGVRAKIRRPTGKQYSEGELKSTARTLKSAKPKKMAAEAEDK